MANPFIPLQGAAFVDGDGKLTVAAHTFLRLLRSEQVTMTEVIVQVPDLADEIEALQQAMLNKQNRDGDLDAISGLGTTGIVARIGNEDWITRTLADSANIAWTDGDGVAGNPTPDLTQLTDAGGGTLLLTAFDAWGRKTGSSAADTDDLPEGVTNLYFTDARVDTRVQAASYTLAGVWDFSHNIAVAGMTVGLGPGEAPANLAFGNAAMASRTTAIGLLAIGDRSLYSNQTQNNNTAIGAFAGWKLVTGVDNIFIGSNAGQNGTSHSNSTLIGGAVAISGNTSAATAVGYRAIFNGGGTQPCALGFTALYALTSGQGNCGVGYQAGRYQTSGAGNCYFGFNAGVTLAIANANVTGQYNSYFGHYTGPGTTTQLNYASAFGAYAVVTTSNTVVLGRTTDNTVIGATGDDASGAKLQVTGSVKATGVLLAEAVAPATPPSGAVIAYAKTDGLLYSKDDAGTETKLSGGGDVVGPAVAVDSEVVLFDTTTGKLIKGGGLLGTAAFAASASFQPIDADLTTIGGLTATTDNFMQAKAGNWASRTLLQVALDLNGSGLTASSVGARIIPQNSKSVDYTLVAADSGKHIYHPGADTTARIWTIPSNASVAYPIGTKVTFINDTAAGVITIAITSDTLVLAGAGTTGSRTLAADGLATAIKMTSTRWQIDGTNLT